VKGAVQVAGAIDQQQGFFIKTHSRRLSGIAARQRCERASPAYNAGMKTALRSFLLAAAAALPLAAAVAQTPAPASTQTKPTDSAHLDQKIERIRTEDAGTRIDELRVGGQTQQITVQPKTGGAAYEVLPAEGAQGKAPAAASGDTNGSRVWNVFKF
jgi:hypothetical protein